MAWFEAALAFSGGALVSATVDQIVARYFAGPRVDCAVSDLSIARTRLRVHKSIRVTDRLRLLLAERSTDSISWGELFVSEEEIDRSILELHESEINTTQAITDIERILAGLNGTTVKDRVGDIGRNQYLIDRLVNAIISAPDSAPPLPSSETQEARVFPLVTKPREVKGQTLEFVHLDLPGNPFPVVGSLSGRPELNKKVQSLGYALSRCNEGMLRAILQIALRYCQSSINHSARLRNEFERIKTETAYLELQLVITNRGGTPAFVATTIDFSVDGTKPMNLAVVDFVEGAETQAPYVEIRDQARRIVDSEPRVAQELERYDSLARYLVVEPGDPRHLRFVSSLPIDGMARDAIQAIRTGYTSCVITLRQYIPRRHKWAAPFARFERRISTRQRLTARQGTA